ncbi:hypothetical protein JRQ81_008097 [Phrynocephalus forsythii]|uniref:Uncharacterized protein n=1 Tax=Phrynocephalus forsythii TaxID=171643 RepID=A0A9Q1AT94_9SAUR|nr:hypothetical protein JRQ81_008097 [Phrynocephalus forsythii]
MRKCVFDGENSYFPGPSHQKGEEDHLGRGQSSPFFTYTNGSFLVKGYHKIIGRRRRSLRLAQNHCKLRHSLQWP